MRFITALAEARTLQTECPAPLKIVARTPDTQVCTAMPMAVYVTVLAIVFGFAVPASAKDRPSDPLLRADDDFGLQRIRRYSSAFWLD